MRLVAAAADLFHRQGMTSTSLADIAHHAEVPPGNVYYYFRAKNDLVAAVADEWLRRVDHLLCEMESDPDPWARLSAFIACAERQRIDYADLGCPVAGQSRPAPTWGRTRGCCGAVVRASVGMDCRSVCGGRSGNRHGKGQCPLPPGRDPGKFPDQPCIGDESLISDAVARLDHWLDGVRGAA